ncbi:sensor domain-containing diguanylate cyclase [Aliiglaciecola sp. LCG003]|uniref:sensor domain-containing diguanylate cyclase n=1 Tax=Aliiglaciecola sp. LCG003 TaxID=3053655 RepID=UPI00257354A6|nr:sensor domain-containing diguanylate cyclase [Aliiglaciecola sp. LCG003]WJG09021.1 diguanylate cyclase [Aliiglaciecola sp. LCG003]
MTNYLSDINSLHSQLNLLGSIEVGITVLDRNFHVLAWNQFMENNSGILPSAIEGKSIFSFFPEIDKDWFTIKTEPVFNLKSPAFIIWEQRPYLFKFDTSRPITSASDFMYQNVTLFPLKSAAGEVEQICLVVYDVTDEALNKKGIQALNEQLEQISRIDGLTGVYNRRYWEETFAQEQKRILRSGSNGSVIILDIDHFKKVNDNHGHPAGDYIIKTLANVIKQTVRETDICGRYGGEEFVVLLPDTDSDSAQFVAERIRAGCEDLLPNYEGSEIPFTVSLGLADFSKQYPDHMAWLEKADQALYIAKNNGRNQLRVYQKPPTNES